MHTATDYESILAEQVATLEAAAGVPSGSLPPTDLAVVFAKVTSEAVEGLRYQANQLTMEADPLLCVRSRSFNAHSRSAGLGETRLATGATGAILVTLDFGSTPTTTSITERDKFTITSPVPGSRDVVYQPTGTTTIGPSVGVVTVTVDATEGSEVYDAPVFSSSGRPLQRFVITSPLVQEGSVVVTVGGTAWQRAASDVLALAGPLDTVYALRCEENTVSVLFGDGIAGAIPPVGNEIRVTYKEGIGIDGRLPAGAEFSGFSSPAAAYITSAVIVADTTGGTNRLSLESAKASFPGSVRSNDRAVTGDDYAALAQRLVPGVFRAATETVAGANLRVVHVCPEGGSSGIVTDLMAANIQTALRARRLLSRRTTVRMCRFARISVRLVATVNPSYVADLAATKVRQTVERLLRAERASFGQRYQLGLLYRGIGTPPYLSGLLVKRFSVLPYWSTYTAFPPSGNGAVPYIYTRDTVKRREWRIVMTAPGSPTSRGEYTVYERLPGTISTTGYAMIGDDRADFTDLASGSWVLVLDPYDVSRRSIPIAGSTSRTVTVTYAGDLRAVGRINDDYAVERSAGTGLLYAGTLTGATAVGDLTLPLTGTWLVGDEILVEDSAGTRFRTSITGGTTGAYTVNEPIPALLTGASVRAVFVAYDGSVEWCVSRGTVPFVAGDELFVDTYANTADFSVREFFFPELAETVIETVGGRH